MGIDGSVAMILLALIVLIIACNIVIVPQACAYVVERLGMFHCVWDVGLHLKMPFIERVVRKVSLLEQTADFVGQPVVTGDGVPMRIDTMICFRITDPRLYAYGVEQPLTAIENLTAAALRNVVGDMERSLTDWSAVNVRMRALLDQALTPWGIRVSRVELKNLVPLKG